MATTATETPPTEVSVVMETAALSLLTGVLSLSVERLGASAVTEAAGSENPRDPSAMAVTPPAGMALSLSSVWDGRAGGDDSYWGWGSITIDRDGVVAVVSRYGRAGGDDS